MKYLKLLVPAFALAIGVAGIASEFKSSPKVSPSGIAFAAPGFQPPLPPCWPAPSCPSKQK